MQRKLWLVFGVVCILFVVLIGRVMYIQHTSGDKYEKIVLSQQDYNSTTIPFQRGNIVDARGTVLATSVDVYNVILDCKVLNASEDYIASTINAVTSSFSEIESETIKTQVSENQFALSSCISSETGRVTVTFVPIPSSLSISRLPP